MQVMNESMKHNIGLRIKTTRKEKRITQEKLAEECGIAKESISNIERGVNYPSFETLGAISKAFGCPITDLIDASYTGTSRQRALLESEAIAVLRSLPEDKLVTAARMVIALR